ncbi:UDP-N-acetylmuramate dehydrogenase [Teredinibacter purpureus]|uniref:UDP-N-acetylmuramate dehydrogenase n=1 Tax=Teredinibacter purpureus TaxID=2731756 RepID=UPI0005F7ABC7|nr:UDP-N-acetylmuramate dehydrogenase [Teredinibacter purpureus]
MIVPNILENVDLQPFNTMAVPSRCRFFLTAENVDDIRYALTWAKQKGVSVSILAGGSNCLLPAFVDALVVHPKLLGITLLEDFETSVLVKASAGENWHAFVLYCLNQGFFGLENLALIPGMVGAAPIQNIGAYGVELKDVFETLEALDRDTGELVEFNSAACEFDYRDSVFKHRLENRVVITAVTFRLSRHASVAECYPALEAALAAVGRSKSATPHDVAAAVVAIRQKKLPDPRELPNAGSFFKNPIVSNNVAKRLKQRNPDVVMFDAGEGYKKIAAGWLIEKAGWKGKEQFGVRVHEHQALVITNPNRVERDQILKMADAISSQVLALFGVTLEQEPRLL